MPTDFDAISCNLNQQCLDHGLDCTLVCMEEACINSNNKQPSPVCSKCVMKDHDLHKMRSWEKAKRQEIESKEEAVIKQRREFQQILITFKQKSSAGTSKDIEEIINKHLKKCTVSRCEGNSNDFNHLIKKSEELTDYFVSFQETKIKLGIKENSEIYFELAGKYSKQSVKDNSDTPSSSRQSLATQTADTYQPTPPNPDREERGVQIEPPQTPQEFESLVEEQPQVIRHNDERLATQTANTYQHTPQNPGPTAVGVQIQPAQSPQLEEVLIDGHQEPIQS